jgi:uncharacterized protein (DUF433 family)
MEDRRSLIGTGLYTIPEASRLTGVPAASIRRWTLGYEYVRAGERHQLPAIVVPQLDPVESMQIITFLDLQEVRFLHAFRSAGVSWVTLRLAHEEARRRLQHAHPFATGRFRTDGRRILTEVIKTARDRALEDIVSRQLAFKKVIAPFLRGLKFRNDIAALWFPARGTRIVLDPERSFGQPIVNKEGVPTAVLARSFKAEGSIERVARWYQVEVPSVRAAVEYESRPVAA